VRGVARHAGGVSPSEECLDLGIGNGVPMAEIEGGVLGTTKIIEVDTGKKDDQKTTPFSGNAMACIQHKRQGQGGVTGHPADNKGNIHTATLTMGTLGREKAGGLGEEMLSQRHFPMSGKKTKGLTHRGSVRALRSKLSS